MFRMVQQGRFLFIGSRRPNFHPVYIDDLVDGFLLAMTSDAAPRSEEHTSELQSLMRLSYAVFCLKKQTSSEPYSTKQLSVISDSQIRMYRQRTTTNSIH